MKSIVAVVFFLLKLAYIRGECFKGNFQCKTDVDLYNKGTNCSVLKWSEFGQCPFYKLNISNNSISESDSPTENNIKQMTFLDMSFNKLKHLPRDFLSQAKALQELNLMNNILSELPDDFFNASTILEILHLEGNPLTSVPSTIFQTRLENLTVDCRCDVTGSVMEIFGLPCKNITSNDCKSHLFKCKSQNDWLDISDFYSLNCGNPNLLALYICVPLVILGAIAGIAIYFYVRKKRNTTNLKNKPDSDMTPAHLQPRYMSRHVESHSKGDSNQSQFPGKDYENIFVGQMHDSPVGQYECLDRKQQDSRRNHTADEDLYMKCDSNEGDQPIYGNTHPNGYNYSGSPNQADDDVYILPDT